MILVKVVGSNAKEQRGNTVGVNSLGKKQTHGKQLKYLLKRRADVARQTQKNSPMRAHIRTSNEDTHSLGCYACFELDA